MTLFGSLPGAEVTHRQVHHQNVPPHSQSLFFFLLEMLWNFFLFQQQERDIGNLEKGLLRICGPFPKGKLEQPHNYDYRPSCSVHCRDFVYVVGITLLQYGRGHAKKPGGNSYILWLLPQDFITLTHLLTPSKVTVELKTSICQCCLLGFWVSLLSVSDIQSDLRWGCFVLFLNAALASTSRDLFCLRFCIESVTSVTFLLLW